MATPLTSTDILLITVNENETIALRTVLEKLISAKASPGQGLINREPYDDYGLIRHQRVCHVEAIMGSSNSGASRDTAKKAIEDLKPKLLIAVGLAWGAFEDKQEIGDVLCADQIQIGSNTKITENDTILRGPKPDMDGTLIKLVKAAQQHHHNEITLHTGTILSREDLFDNKKYRDKFIAKVPNIVGGEMEGQGIYQAIRESHTKPDFLIIKGICDWGFKKNAHATDKKKNQILAASNAANLCVSLISNYSLIPDIQANTPLVDNTPSLPPPSLGSSSVNITTTNFGSSGLDFLNELKSPAIDISIAKGSAEFEERMFVYWPIRIRTPNIVHAVQTFVATGLSQRGFTVQLCFDDLGTPEGFASVDDGVEALSNSIEKWAKRISPNYKTGTLTYTARRFSEFVGDTKSRTPMDGALESLGGNLVKWLLGTEELRKVLKDSKLLLPDDAVALDKKPRKLLSPAVVWTVLGLITKDIPNCNGVLTLGGDDEKAIWNIPNVNTIPIHNIFLPKVRGDMDSEGLKPKSKKDIEESIQNQLEVKNWFIRYAWHLPELLSGVNTTSIENKLTTDNSRAAQYIEGFIL
jgi:nucleoside phosphorylase